MTKKRGIWVAIGISLLCFVLNFGLFIYFYNQLATPFITEEQRVSNAEYIMSLTVGGFAVAAIVIGFFVFNFLGSYWIPGRYPNIVEPLNLRFSILI